MNKGRFLHYSLFPAVSPGAGDVDSLTGVVDILTGVVDIPTGVVDN
jgi:hypothetical protein